MNKKYIHSKSAVNYHINQNPINFSRSCNRTSSMALSDLKSAALMDQYCSKKMGFNEEIFVIELKKGEVTKGPYEGGKPDATFSFTDADFFKIATGNMNPQIAFMRGKMKVKGSLSAAQKFTPDIFPKPSKM